MNRRNVLRCISCMYAWIFLMSCSDGIVEEAKVVDTSSVSLSGMELVQPLGNVLDLSGEDALWAEVLLASSSTRLDLATKAGDPGEEVLVTGVTDEFVIANEATMNELLALCGEAIACDMSSNPVVSVDTKVVKTTVRGARALVNDEVVADIEYPKISIEDLVKDILHQWADRIRQGKAFRLKVEVYFEKPILGGLLGKGQCCTLYF